MTGTARARWTGALMDEVIAAFVQATERSERIGFDAIELHGGAWLSVERVPLADRQPPG